MNNKILVELQESMGSDLSIANAAWTSTYDKDRREDKYSDPEKVVAMVSKLIKDGHGTPVESVVLRFWIRMPIITDRQHMTHRICSHNGLSGRYRTMPTDYFDIPDDAMEIIEKVDQKVQNPFPTLENPNLDFTVFGAYYESCETANNNYKLSIDKLKFAEKQKIITNVEFKRVREIIRGQLPTAGMIERTTIMNLRSFANYQKQRNSDHAQPEIRQVAKLMLEEVKKANIAPIAIATLEEVGWVI